MYSHFCGCINGSVILSGAQRSRRTSSCAGRFFGQSPQNDIAGFAGASGQICHCEERSDAAIRFLWTGVRIPTPVSPARNDIAGLFLRVQERRVCTRAFLSLSHGFAMPAPSSEGANAGVIPAGNLPASAGPAGPSAPAAPASCRRSAGAPPRSSSAPLPSPPSARHGSGGTA